VSTDEWLRAKQTDIGFTENKESGPVAPSFQRRFGQALGELKERFERHVAELTKGKDASKVRIV